MNDTLMSQLVKEYKHATRALRRLMEQDDTVDGYGERFDELMDRCRELRLAFERLENERNDAART